MDENKQQILEAVAQAEKQLQPFDRSLDGVSYDDINTEFDVSDFGINPSAYIPLRLAELSEREPPYLQQVQDPGNSASANYRLTEDGWRVVGVVPP